MNDPNLELKNIEKGNLTIKLTVKHCRTRNFEQILIKK